MKSREKNRKSFRTPQLKQYSTIWLTKTGHDLLRKAKKLEKKSMMQIVDDLIKNSYKNL